MIVNFSKPSPVVESVSPQIIMQPETDRDRVVLENIVASGIASGMGRIAIPPYHLSHVEIAIVTGGIAKEEPDPEPPAATAKWKAVWQQKPHDSHSRMVHEFFGPVDRDKAMDSAHLDIQNIYCCSTFTIHSLDRIPITD